MTLLKIGHDLLRSAIQKQRISPFRNVVAAKMESETVNANAEVDEDLVPAPHISHVDRINDTTLCVSFSDNTRCNFNTVWLRDSCRCPACVHPLTQGRRVDCTHFSPKIRPLSWALKDSGILEIIWPQEQAGKPISVSKSVYTKQQSRQHVTAFSAEWLYQFRPLFERSSSELPDAVQIEDETYCPLTSIILWNAEAFEEDPPEVHYVKFLKKRPALKQVLKNVAKFGLCIIKDVPIKEGEIARVAKRMGFIREIGCGSTFHIGQPTERQPRNMTTTNNLNNQAYREWSPGVQLLHCIRNDQPALGSTADSPAKHEFIDGFAAAQWLRYQEPSAFTVLTQTPVTFSFLDVERDRWHRETNPIITLDSRAQIKEVHYSTLSMRPPLLPTTRITEFYDAFRVFSKRLQDQSLVFDLQMEPGDLVIFNNRRVIERGTCRMDASSDIFMEGCYMDADEILALYEKIKKDDAIDEK
ncbi:gamma-butyrobetaine dioxygenase-like [Tropilaelaps mercedesae]|uniref:Gamma-butyrobetaine dioxygenase-like n=1 Tax=Tropilaelaps mercedesae TaxID=418985 RepID=A0A1V9XA92_9ACAR|nr:gamma-butyrobetaine dioxygenase-like [Tropilaelaps mercedesae]